MCVYTHHVLSFPLFSLLHLLLSFCPSTLLFHATQCTHTHTHTLLSHTTYLGYTLKHTHTHTHTHMHRHGHTHIKYTYILNPPSHQTQKHTQCKHVSVYFCETHNS